MRVGRLAIPFARRPGSITAVDVSPAMLAVATGEARQLASSRAVRATRWNERVPIVGDRPSPEFLVFDGLRIDLPDASIERIVSFDAFHHVPNPEAILREFARVLKPGGIAGCAEPGLRHSETPQSQHEMRTYGIVENDIDIHAIWRAAGACGFRDLQMMVFHGSPFHLSLEAFARDSSR